MNGRDNLSIIDHLLRGSVQAPQPVSTYGQWKPFWCALTPQWREPVDRALAGGLAADRPAWAFAAGYQAAIQALIAPLAMDGLGAVCITEAGGPHPARIKCRLVADPLKAGHWCLSGTKAFVSGAAEADTLWVAASTNGPGGGRDARGGRRSLRMAAVSSLSPGVTIEPLPALELVPEIPHARVSFAAVRLGSDDILTGDGYLGAMKPFRTLEDLHVSAAFLGWLFGVGRRANWPRETLAAILTHIVTARSLALQPPLDSHVHIVLGGLLDQVDSILAGSERLWERVDTKVRKRWERDRGILKIAASARHRRLDVAWWAYKTP